MLKYQCEEGIKVKSDKKYILKKVSSTIELVSINGINIANIYLINYGSNHLISNNCSKTSVGILNLFLTIGILSVNLAYTNYNIYEKSKNKKK